MANNVSLIRREDHASIEEFCHAVRASARRSTDAFSSALKEWSALYEQFGSRWTVNPPDPQFRVAVAKTAAAVTCSYCKVFVHFSQLIDSASGEQEVIVVLRKNLVDELKNQMLSHDEARLQWTAFSNLVK